MAQKEVEEEGGEEEEDPNWKVGTGRVWRQWCDGAMAKLDEQNKLRQQAEKERKEMEDEKERGWRKRCAEMLVEDQGKVLHSDGTRRNIFEEEERERRRRRRRRREWSDETEQGQEALLEKWMRWQMVDEVEADCWASTWDGGVAEPVR